MAGSSPAGILAIPQIARLPHHLKRHIVDQRFDEYTAIDHAVWRYILRQAVAFHREHAHASFVDGLARTGIRLDRIPRVEEMNEVLGRIGWGAATVDGFIPPAALMEFQAHRVLVIAAAMRQPDHVEYTPAPDIVHGAAGHAPFIANAEYAEYLRRFGEYAPKAIPSRQDNELYEAIRHLSILKEAARSSPGDIAAAERAVAERQARPGEPSEVALLSRLHWWTVEYGLIGDVDAPKIFGAGLLSSLGEAARCLTGAVRKLPYPIDAAQVPFDITTMQPQLFVTPDFSRLTDVLEQFADTMAFRRGGLEGLRKAIDAGEVTTAVFSSGLQVSGRFVEAATDDHDSPAYVRTLGPTALAVGDRELPSHGRGYHTHGFGSPVGRIRGIDGPIESATDRELGELGLEPGRVVSLSFESGIEVKGRLDRLHREDGRLVLASFSGCRVTWGDAVLFEPTWGAYDCAAGDRIVSVFNGAADKDRFEQAAFVPHERTAVAPLSVERRRLASLYGAVREVRERQDGFEILGALYHEARASHAGDWLLALEILELLGESSTDPALAREIQAALDQRAAGGQGSSRLIARGLSLIVP